jgi:hypothetical protein
MTISQQERQRRELYQDVRPEIVAGIRAGADTVELAQQLAGRTGVPLQEVYRWVQHTEDWVDRDRRRRAMATAVPLWIGGVLLVTAAVTALTGPGGNQPALSIGLAISGLAALLVFVALGHRFGLRLRR